jgi:hypothetical protein
MARGEITGKKPAQTVALVEPTGKSEPETPAKKAKATPPVPPAWHTLTEFAAAHRLSMAMLFKLKNEGRGPREIAIGSRRYVTFEDAARWRAEREAESPAALEEAAAKKAAAKKAAAQQQETTAA